MSKNILTFDVFTKLCPNKCRDFFLANFLWGGRLRRHTNDTVTPSGVFKHYTRQPNIRDAPSGWVQYTFSKKYGDSTCALLSMTSEVWRHQRSDVILNQCQRWQFHRSHWIKLIVATSFWLSNREVILVNWDLSTGLGGLTTQDVLGWSTLLHAGCWAVELNFALLIPLDEGGGHDRRLVTVGTLHHLPAWLENHTFPPKAG